MLYVGKMKTTHTDVAHHPLKGICNAFNLRNTGYRTIRIFFFLNDYIYKIQFEIVLLILVFELFEVFFN